MRRQLATLILLLITISTSAQVVRLPTVKENLPKDTTENNWFLTRLKSEYTDFIAVYQYSTWSWKDFIQALALRNDSVFILTIIRNRSNIKEIKQRAISIEQNGFNQVVDTLKSLDFFNIKDEREIARCEKQTKEMVNGKLVILSTSTAYISDCTQTDFFIYSNNTLHFAGYYCLDKVEEICPVSKTWKNVLHIRNFLDQTFEKHSR